MNTPSSANKNCAFESASLYHSKTSAFSRLRNSNSEGSANSSCPFFRFEMRRRLGRLHPTGKLAYSVVVRLALGLSSMSFTLSAWKTKNVLSVEVKSIVSGSESFLPAPSNALL